MTRKPMIWKEPTMTGYKWHWRCCRAPECAATWSSALVDLAGHWRKIHK